MVNYPNLTETQQQNLPALIKPAEAMPVKFDDSTHQLWFCETSDGPMVLKLCNHETIKISPFWQGMNSLFAVNFPDSLSQIEHIHQFLGEQSCLTIPQYIASESSSYVLTRYLSGDDVDFENVSDVMVTQLARHIAQLHQHHHSNWGAFHQAVFSDKQWPEQLQHTLITLAELHSIPKHILDHALAQAKNLNVSMFSPIMLDLRWDQMLHQQGQLSALVDMDAFVIGPRELELVLLEYQLNKKQADYFEASYREFSEIPDLAEQRYCYRLLLFLMNSLGETDINKWMDAPTRW